MAVAPGLSADRGSAVLNGLQAIAGGQPAEPNISETLANAAYRALRADIIKGARAPGERLRIEKLKIIYGFGPTPLREALQMLAADQLVLAEGHRGFSVTELDLDNFRDLNVTRTAVEREALPTGEKA